MLYIKTSGFTLYTIPLLFSVLGRLGRTLKALPQGMSIGRGYAVTIALLHSRRFELVFTFNLFRLIGVASLVCLELSLGRV